MKQRLTTSSSPFLAVLVCMCLFSGNAVAQIGFDGGTANPGDWNDPNNWTGNVLPDPNDSLTDVGVNPAFGPAGALLSATANYSSGTTTIGELRVGRGNNTAGVVNQSGGTLTTEGGGWSFIGVDGDPNNPNTGEYNLTNNAIWNNLNGPLLVGGGGGSDRTAGQENVGTINIADTAQLNVDAFGVGWNDRNKGIVNQTGGDVTVSNWMNIGDTGASTGEYNISGGSLTVFVELTVGQNSDASGTLNVSDTASLDVDQLRLGRDVGTGVMNVTGSQASIVLGSLQMGYNSPSNPTVAKGVLNFTSDSSGVSTIEVVDSVWLNDLGIAGDFDLDGFVTAQDFLEWQRDPNVGNLADWEANFGQSAGSASLIVDLTSNAPPSGDILLVDNQSVNAINGTFAGLPEGALVPNSGGRFISYVYGTGGNDIALIQLPSINAVPEPTCLALVLGALFCSMGRKQRR